jgi:hypothetical protein
MTKKMFLRLCPAILAAGLISTPVLTQDRERAGLDDRLNRLERRITEMAERQEKAIQQRLAPGLHRPGGNPAVAPCAACPLLPAQPKAVQPPIGPKCPVRCCPWLLVSLLALAATVNILLAVWIFTDIRKRGDGHGIFVALALVAGIPTAIIYALVRIGDKKS